MLTRDWLRKRGSYRNYGELDDATLEQGKAYVNDVSSFNASQIDVDILSALDDLEGLKLIDQYQAKEDQEALNTIKQLWNETFD